VQKGNHDNGDEAQKYKVIQQNLQEGILSRDEIVQILTSAKSTRAISDNTELAKLTDSDANDSLFLHQFLNYVAQNFNDADVRRVLTRASEVSKKDREDKYSFSAAACDLTPSIMQSVQWEFEEMLQYFRDNWDSEHEIKVKTTNNGSYKTVTYTWWKEEEFGFVWNDKKWTTLKSLLSKDGCFVKTADKP